VVEQAAEGIVLFDVDSKRALEANVACQNLLGYTPEAILRLTSHQFSEVLIASPEPPRLHLSGAKVVSKVVSNGISSSPYLDVSYPTEYLAEATLQSVRFRPIS
jgi:hypothetical protein